MEDQAVSIGKIVPYMLFVGAVFLTGFVFAILNVPLLWLFRQPLYPSDGAELFRLYCEQVLTFMAASDSASGFLVLALLCLATGFFVNLASEAMATVAGGMVMGLARFPGVRLIVPDARLFTYASYFADGHAKFRLWLLANPAAKLQWEWELFNFVLYWGFTTNLLAAYVMAHALTGSSVSLLLVLCVVTGAYSLLRSRVLLRYQDECVASMGSRAEPSR